jgi:hypothetical protein
MSERREIHIKEFDLDMLPPGRDDWQDPKTTGSKIVVIGKPGTGKTQLISSILYEKAHIFPVAQIYSGTEDSNGHYGKSFPTSFIFDEVTVERKEAFKDRQKIAKKYLSNPWAIQLEDDVSDDVAMFKKKIYHSAYKNGRHWKKLHILSLQYCMDILPVIRTNIDATFILRETILRNRKALWENYAGVISDFSDFCQILDYITNDFTALVILNRVQSNNVEDCIFYYKAEIPPDDWRFGCDDYWLYHETRNNKKEDNDLPPI